MVFFSLISDAKNNTPQKNPKDFDILKRKQESICLMYLLQ